MKNKSIFFAICALTVIPLGVNASTVTYSFNLDGRQETPANSSPAAGSAQLIIDDVGNTASFALLALNLLGTPSAAHVHFAAAGASGAIVFDLAGNADSAGSVTIGSFAIPNSVAVNGQNKALSLGLGALINATPWDYYINLHTASFPVGEIRGQLASAPVPLPAAVWLFGSTLTGFVLLLRRKI
ncbi:MAG: CHRD domain-containing protein [Gammaproteobacteria bacterium]|nr:CHRD domain-containing protein [Gammaproteobacteria bacterium]